MFWAQSRVRCVWAGLSPSRVAFQLPLLFCDTATHVDALRLFALRVCLCFPREDAGFRLPTTHFCPFGGDLAAVGKV